MKHLTYNVLIPLIVPLSFLAVATTPVDFFGCAMRGYIALSITILGLIYAVVISLMSIKLSQEEKLWRLLSAFILAIPAVYIVLTEM